MTRDDTAIVLRRVSAVWGRAKATADVVDAWSEALAERSMRDVHDALDRIMNAGEPGPNLPRVLVELRRGLPTTVRPEYVVTEPEQHEHTDAEYAEIGLRNIARIRAEVAERARARAQAGGVDREAMARELGLHVVTSAVLDPDVEPF